MKTIPLRISSIKAGDVFFEDASGHMIQCEALENAESDESGFMVRASTPLGTRVFFETKGGPKLRLYVQAPTPPLPPVPNPNGSA